MIEIVYSLFGKNSRLEDLSVKRDVFQLSRPESELSSSNLDEFVRAPKPETGVFKLPIEALNLLVDISNWADSVCFRFK